jgi:uncharacterized protein YjbI with pentapeptide repeats
MMPIGWAIGGMLALSAGIAAVTLFIGLHALHVHGFKPEPLLTSDTLYNLLKVAFGFAAGVGGVIALVTAYRRQRVAEIAQDLDATRLLNERYATAAGQLGHDSPAVRLAGVYAMAGLADDWPAQRQTCVSTLCAFLRMPYQLSTSDAPPEEQQADQALREVRHTVIAVITAHRQPDDSRPAGLQDWRGLALDFTGARIDGGSFDGADLSNASFKNVRFSGNVGFLDAILHGTEFDYAEFGGDVSFMNAHFGELWTTFYHARFTDGAVGFEYAQVNGVVRFDSAQFTGSNVGFDFAHLSDGDVRFDHARFSDGTVTFKNAKFDGSELTFESTQFDGGTVDLSESGWPNVSGQPHPTYLDSQSPPGLLLPTSTSQPTAS